MDVKLVLNVPLVTCCQPMQGRLSTLRKLAWVRGSSSTAVFLVLANLTCFCSGQTQVLSPPDQSQTVQESQLIDGLLELIESSPQPKRTDAGVPSDFSSKPPVPNLERIGSGTVAAEEDRTTENPLQIIRTLMLNVSETMRRGSVGAETLQLQGDVIEHLDSLIESLRQQEAASTVSEQLEDNDSLEGELEGEADFDDQQTRAEEGKAEDEADSQAEDVKESEPSGGEQPQESSDIENEGGLPGQGVTRPGLVAEPRDPGELQRSVWGHLPEQVRSQLQARMAEQFLPSYREQLEAYFRALLNQERME